MARKVLSAITLAVVIGSAESPVDALPNLQLYFDQALNPVLFITPLMKDGRQI